MRASSLGRLVALVVVLLTVTSSTNAAVGLVFTVDSVGDLADAAPDDGICADSTGACTLRAAIQQSNESEGSTDTIAFALPAASTSIHPGAELPLITDTVVIDGTTQPGFVDAPIVEVNGTGLAGGSRGLRIGDAGGTVVRGLAVNGFSVQIAIGEPQAGAGVRIVGSYLGTDATGGVAAGRVTGTGIHIRGGSDHVIGGTAAADRNVISGNGFAAIAIDFPAGAVTIQGNYIGTNAAGDGPVENVPGAAVGNGIYSTTSARVVVGGSAPGAGNLISGNRSVGIDLFGGSGHVIAGNRIGTDRSGTKPVPNSVGVETEMFAKGSVEIRNNVVSGNRGTGIHLRGDLGSIVQGNMVGVDADGLDAVPNGDGIGLTSTDGVLIGGTTPAERNIISGNGGQSGGFGSGINFFNFSERNVIQGNYIGVGADGRTNRGNRGAGISCCGLPGNEGHNVVGGLVPGAGNVIAFNGFFGITSPNPFVLGPLVSILGNSIHSNGLLGISLAGGPTPNDDLDQDVGPNDFQNFPVVESVTSAGGQTVATASLKSIPNTDFHLEFFRNASCNPPTPTTQFFGEGETLVGTTEVRTDAAGSWSGAVVLGGATGATEVITATATRFVEPGTSLAGSTSEFSECLADLSITKSDEPDPVAAGQPLTYTIDVANAGPAPAASARVTDTLPAGVVVQSIAPSQGSCAQVSSTITCLLGAIPRGGTARITILVNPGTTVRTLTNRVSVSGEPRDPDASDNSSTATTDVVTGATIVIEKQTLPDGSPHVFGFSGEITASLRDGQTTSKTIAPGTYTVSELVPAGWDSTSIQCADPSNNSTSSTAPVGPGGTATAMLRVAALETVKCTFTNTQRGTIIVRKRTDPAGRQERFRFTGDVSGTIGDGEELVVGDLVPGTYSATEDDPRPEFDLVSITCDDSQSLGDVASRSARFRLDPGERVTCTFTNRKRGLVELLKLTNGVPRPDLDIRFVLYETRNDPIRIDGDMVLEELSTVGDPDGVLAFVTRLVPGATYTICESPVPAGWTSQWSVVTAEGIQIVTPYNPNALDTPPEDVGVRCFNFSIDPAQTVRFEVRNDSPGGGPRTIGYWKNWNRCTGGGQAANAARNGGAAGGFFLVEDVVPQLIGDFTVTSCTQAVRLLSKQDQAGKAKASDAAYELGAQLLATRFNVAAGARACSAVQAAVLDGQALLGQLDFTGSGDYLGSKSKDARRAEALSLASSLDRYNNGNLC